MIVLDIKRSNIIREKFISTFIDVKSDHYINYIKNVYQHSDGLCYDGYLWDCFVNASSISENESVDILNKQKNIYIMWDINSSDNIFVENYWKYPKSGIIYDDIFKQELRKELPEDIYIFDESFSWCVVYTHETDYNDNPYCLFVKV